MRDSKIYLKPPPSHGALPPEAWPKMPLPKAHPRLPPLVAAQPLPHPLLLAVARTLRPEERVSEGPTVGRGEGEGRGVEAVGAEAEDEGPKKVTRRR
jgi:hypothetical protein